MLLRVEALEGEIADVAAAGGTPRARPFGTGSLAGSRINRDGLVPGTSAPAFRLTRIDGGELSLDEYRGRRVLLVFSDSACGPCDRLAPRLEELSRRTAGVDVVMVSRRTIDSNRRKAAAYGLTFPIVLQRQWEISRLYAKFATPMAYVIDEDGRIATHVAQGVEPILSLLSSASSVDEKYTVRPSRLTRAGPMTSPMTEYRSASHGHSTTDPSTMPFAQQKEIPGHLREAEDDRGVAPPPCPAIRRADRARARRRAVAARRCPPPASRTDRVMTEKQ